MTQDELKDLLDQVAAACRDRGMDMQAVDQLRRGPTLYEVIQHAPTEPLSPHAQDELEATVDQLRQIQTRLVFGGFGTSLEKQIGSIISIAKEHLRSDLGSGRVGSISPEPSSTGSLSHFTFGTKPIFGDNPNLGSSIEGKWPPQ
jgi:hypothetical protein